MDSATPRRFSLFSSCLGGSGRSSEDEDSEGLYELDDSSFLAEKQAHIDAYRTPSSHVESLSPSSGRSTDASTKKMSSNFSMRPKHSVPFFDRESVPFFDREPALELSRVSIVEDSSENRVSFLSDTYQRFMSQQPTRSTRMLSLRFK